MKENRVVAAGREADRVDVLDPVGEAAGEARFLGGPLGLGDGFGGEVDASTRAQRPLARMSRSKRPVPQPTDSPSGKGAGAYFAANHSIGQRLGSPVTRRLMARRTSGWEPQ